MTKWLSSLLLIVGYLQYASCIKVEDPLDDLCKKVVMLEKKMDTLSGFFWDLDNSVKANKKTLKTMDSRLINLEDSVNKKIENLVLTMDKQKTKVDETLKDMKQDLKNVTKTVHDGSRTIAQHDTSIRKLVNKSTELIKDLKNITVEMKNLHNEDERRISLHDNKIEKLENKSVQLVIGLGNMNRTMKNLHNESLTAISQMNDGCHKKIEDIEKKSNEVKGTLIQFEMYTQYMKSYIKDFGIPFEDMIQFSHLPDHRVYDDALLRKYLDQVIPFEKFESMWGKGSLRGAMEVMRTMDEEKRKSLRNSIARVEKMNRLKFVESPRNTKMIYGEFGKDEGGEVFVRGFVKVKAENEWHSIHPWKCYPPKSYKYFGQHEANVACKDGGYSYGTFVTYETSSSWDHPWLKYVEVICTGQERRLIDCEYQIHYYNHYIRNVEVQCYF